MPIRTTVAPRLSDRTQTIRAPSADVQLTLLLTLYTTPVVNLYLDRLRPRSASPAQTAPHEQARSPS